MGTIYILLGLIFLLGFTGGGFLISNAIVDSLSNTQFMGQPILAFIGVSDPTTVYILIAGLCAAIGVLICLPLVMCGSNFNRINRLKKEIRQLKGR